MKRWLLIPGVLLIALSCSGGDAEKGTSLPTIPVKTSKAELGSISVVREFGGGLEGSKQADVFVRLSEAVESLPHRIGDRVGQGAVLAYLDKGGPSSQYFQAKAAFDNADKLFKKMKYLYDEKAISETQFNDAESGFEIARANFQAARDLVEITSPISGTLVELNLRAGDVPLPGSVGARVALIDSLRMNFGVPPTVAEKFARGMTGTVTVTGDTAHYDCVVTRIASAADPQTRTFTVEVTVANPDRRLQPGTFAKARFITESVDNAVRVPQSALISEEGIYTLFVVQNDTARVRTVTVGAKNEHSVQVVSGVNAGDEIVYLGQAFLSDGYPIIRSEK